MLALKYDYMFEPFLEEIHAFTPVVSDKERSVAYKEGSQLPANEILDQTGGNMFIDFRLITASNTVLLDPSSKSFNRNLPYRFCPAFFDQVMAGGNTICSGKIPLSITQDVQRIVYSVCGGGFVFQMVEICDNGIDDDGDGLIDCEDDDCCFFSQCECETPQVEICDNGIDDDGDGDIDGEDSDCVFSSPCMRDYYLEDNFFREFELLNPQVLTQMGGNLCQEVINIQLTASDLMATFVRGGAFYPDFPNTTELEEYYSFLIKIHWGTANNTQGQFQDLVYIFNIFDLSNAPDFTWESFSGGGQGTGGSAGVAIVTLNEPGLTETFPVSLEDVQFFSASDVCRVNNWDPSIFGNIVRFSAHEFDACTLQTTTGETSTTVTMETHQSGFTINLGIGDSLDGAVTGGLMYTNMNTLATTETNEISSSYQTSYANTFYLGQVNYNYCWEDQATQEQIHQISFGNVAYLRLGTTVCNN